MDADDIVPAADGVHLWLSAPDAGRILEIAGDGSVVTTLVDPRRPEGVVPLADGRLVVAEQTPNRLVTLDPATGAVTPLLALAGPGGKDVGVDSIAWDAATSSLLVPDSPAGTLLAVSPDGRLVRTLARGLGRPVGAAALPGGDVLVAVENSPGVVRVSPTGQVTPAAHLLSVDDVLPLPDGSVAVADLHGHDVLRLDPGTGTTTVLAAGVAAPQGLALSGQTLLATDETSRTLLAVPTC